MAGDLNVKAEIEYVLKDQGITAAVSKVKELETAQKKVTEETKKSAEATGSFAAGLKQVGAYAASFLAAGSIISFLRSSQREFIEAERSTQRLQMALRLLGSEYSGSFEAVSKYADELEKLTGIDADVIRSAQSVLVTIGRLSGETLNRATRAALDLSAALGTDLNNAAMIVAKAGAGSEGALGRMGIKIDEAVPPAERLEEILRALESRVGGVAEEMGNTLPGAVDKSKTAFKNFMEAAGDIFTSPGGISLWTKSLQFFTDVLKQMNQNAKENTDTLRSLFGLTPIDRSAPKPKVYEDQSGYSETVTVKGMSDADLKALDEKRAKEAKQRAEDIADAERDVWRKLAEDEIQLERDTVEAIADVNRLAVSLDAQQAEEKLAAEEEVAKIRIDTAREAIQAELDNQRATLEDQMKNRTELVDLWLEEQLALVKGNKNAEVALYKQAEQKKNIIAEDGAEKRQKIAKAEQEVVNQANWDAATSSVEALSAIFGEKKAFAIALAIMNMARAVTAIWADENLPTAAKPAFTAAAVAACVAQIATIRSTNLGGSGGGGTGGGGGGGRGGSNFARTVGTGNGSASSPPPYTQAGGSQSQSTTYDHRVGANIVINGPVVGGRAGVAELYRLLEQERRAQRSRLIR
jgi:hypothetical protein